VGSPRRLMRLPRPIFSVLDAYPISARPAGLDRNPFYQRGLLNVDVRVTKGVEWWKDHGIFLFGVGVYNLTNHTNPILVSAYYGLDTYRGLIETSKPVKYSSAFNGSSDYSVTTFGSLPGHW
jgi:hypothetical protein